MVGFGSSGATRLYKILSSVGRWLVRSPRQVILISHIRQGYSVIDTLTILSYETAIIGPTAARKPLTSRDDP